MRHEMEGTTWQPVPGHKSDHVPVEIDENGNPSSRDGEDEDAVHYSAVPIEEDGTATIRARSGKITDIRVTHKDVEAHGVTPGCPACRHIHDNKEVPRGVGHSAVCRKRMRDLIGINEDTRDRVERADQRRQKRDEPIGNLEQSEGGYGKTCSPTNKNANSKASKSDGRKF